MEPTALALPDLSSTYPIHPEQARKFQQNGHQLLRNILSDEEITAYRDVIVQAADRHN
ncbi:MAG: phytanoyl-CoA dioxygenase family protein, partial [Sphingobacteriaceae bacterium]|nr:phytanoyl-CoA dioxygenase family protein [Cytophagaceae bacterium]